MIEDIFRAIFRLAPSEKRINADIATMRQLTRPLADQVIPWEKEHEIELLSLNATMKTQKDGMDKILWGVLQSIYFEPMAAWAYKDYVKGEQDALLYCRTKEAEFIYRIRPFRLAFYRDRGQGCGTRVRRPSAAPAPAAGVHAPRQDGPGGGPYLPGLRLRRGDHPLAGQQKAEITVLLPYIGLRFVHLRV